MAINLLVTLQYAQTYFLKDDGESSCIISLDEKISIKEAKEQGLKPLLILGAASSLFCWEHHQFYLPDDTISVKRFLARLFAYSKLHVHDNIEFDRRLNGAVSDTVLSWLHDIGVSYQFTQSSNASFARRIRPIQESSALGDAERACARANLDRSLSTKAFVEMANELQRKEMANHCVGWMCSDDEGKLQCYNSPDFYLPVTEDILVAAQGPDENDIDRNKAIAIKVKKNKLPMVIDYDKPRPCLPFIRACWTYERSESEEIIECNMPPIDVDNRMQLKDSMRNLVHGLGLTYKDVAEALGVGLVEVHHYMESHDAFNSPVAESINDFLGIALSVHQYRDSGGYYAHWKLKNTCSVYTISPNINRNALVRLIMDFFFVNDTSKPVEISDASDSDHHVVIYDSYLEGPQFVCLCVPKVVGRVETILKNEFDWQEESGYRHAKYYHSWTDLFVKLGRFDGRRDELSRFQKNACEGFMYGLTAHTVTD